MTVLNVLSTNTIASGATEYQVVKTGFYRVGSTAGAATVTFGSGPAITLVQNDFILLKGGKPGQAKIVKSKNDDLKMHDPNNIKNLSPIVFNTKSQPKLSNINPTCYDSYLNEKFINLCPIFFITSMATEKGEIMPIFFKASYGRMHVFFFEGSVMGHVQG